MRFKTESYLIMQHYADDLVPKVTKGTLISSKLNPEVENRTLLCDIVQMTWFQKTPLIVPNGTMRLKIEPYYAMLYILMVPNETQKRVI